MTQELTKPAATGVAVPERNVYEQYADAVNAQRIVGELLKFSKGDWLVGREGDELAPGTELVADCSGMQVGWIKWKDFKPVEYRMGRIADGFLPARRSELDELSDLDWPRDEATGQPRDPWQLSNSMVLMDPATRQLYTLATASRGGLNAIGKLLGQYGKHVRLNPDELPLVALHSDSYKHPNKAFGKIAIPVLKVIAWVDRTEFDSVNAEGIDAAVTEAVETQNRRGEEGDRSGPRPASKPPAKAGKRPNDYAAAKGRRPHKDGDHDIPF